MLFRLLGTLASVLERSLVSDCDSEETEAETRVTAVCPIRSEVESGVCLDAN